jgi:hypothetical protein
MASRMTGSGDDVIGRAEVAWVLDELIIDDWLIWLLVAGCWLLVVFANVIAT